MYKTVVIGYAPKADTMAKKWKVLKKCLKFK